MSEKKKTKTITCGKNSYEVWEFARFSGNFSSILNGTFEEEEEPTNLQHINGKSRITVGQDSHQEADKGVQETES
jgi:hypothetical protein